MVDDRQVGFMVDRVRDGRHLLIHTEIDDEVEGRGVGSSLVRQVLDRIRGEGGTIVPLCPFVRAWLERHPDYDDLVEHDELARRLSAR